MESNFFYWIARFVHLLILHENMEALNPSAPPFASGLRTFVKNGDTYLVQKDNVVSLILSIVLLTTVLTTKEVIPKSQTSNRLVCAFNSTIARVAFIATILFYAKAKPTIAILMAGIFVLLIHQYHQIKTAETFAQIEYSSATSTAPACADVTISDLLKMTNGDAATVLRLARQCGLPYGVAFTDANAPLIATVLLANNIAITPSCSPLNYDATDNVRTVSEQVVDTNFVPTGAIVNTELSALEQ